MRFKVHFPVLGLTLLCLSVLLVAGNASAKTKSDTVTVDANDTYSVSFNARSGDLDWEVIVYGEWFSGDYEHTNVDMEIYDESEDEMEYYLIDVEDDIGTQDLDSTGEFSLRIINNNDFEIEVYYHLEYKEATFLTACCCNAAFFVPLSVLVALVLILNIVKRKV